MVPNNDFEFTSKSAIKTIDVKHESGLPLKAFLCGDCGSVLCKEADDGKNMKICFAGTLDGSDGLLEKALMAELWTKYRLGWTGQVGSGSMKQCLEFT